MKKLSIEFEELTASNNHTEAAQLLINVFGNRSEKVVMQMIVDRHNKAGHISECDQRMRDGLVKKYFSCMSYKTQNCLMKKASLEKFFGAELETLQTWGVPGVDEAYIKTSDLLKISSVEFVRHVECEVMMWLFEGKIIDFKTMQREEAEAEKAFHKSHPELNP